MPAASKRREKEKKEERSSSSPRLRTRQRKKPQDDLRRLEEEAALREKALKELGSGARAEEQRCRTPSPSPAAAPLLLFVRIDENLDLGVCNLQDVTLQIPVPQSCRVRDILKSVSSLLRCNRDSCRVLRRQVREPAEAKLALDENEFVGKVLEHEDVVCCGRKKAFEAKAELPDEKEETCSKVVKFIGFPQDSNLRLLNEVPFTRRGVIDDKPSFSAVIGGNEYLLSFYRDHLMWKVGFARDWNGPAAMVYGEASDYLHVLDPTAIRTRWFGNETGISGDFVDFPDVRCIQHADEQATVAHIGRAAAPSSSSGGREERSRSRHPPAAPPVERGCSLATVRGSVGVMARADAGQAARSRRRHRPLSTEASRIAPASVELTGNSIVVMFMPG